jgi:hypothetical protein
MFFILIVTLKIQITYSVFIHDVTGILTDNISCQGVNND